MGSMARRVAHHRCAVCLARLANQVPHGTLADPEALRAGVFCRSQKIATTAGVSRVSAENDHIEARLLHIEREVADMKVVAAEHRAALREDIQKATQATVELRALTTANATRIDGVKSDTEEIVSLLKGMKVLGALLKWIAGFSFIGGPLYIVGKALKWWA